MTIKVYHTKNFSLNANMTFLDEEALKKYVPMREHYKPVADVNIPDEEYGDAFRLTNHIDRAWWENEEVVLFEESRSTSVGDLIELSDGTLMVCASVGWVKVEWKPEKPYRIINKDGNLIGNLWLHTIKDIHGDDIANIDDENHIVTLKTAH